MSMAKTRFRRCIGVMGARGLSGFSWRGLRFGTTDWSDSQVLEFRPWGFMTLVTRRLEDENTLIWEYPGQPTSRLRRVCRLPGSEV